MQLSGSGTETQVWYRCRDTLPSNPDVLVRVSIAAIQIRGHKTFRVPLGTTRTGGELDANGTPSDDIMTTVGVAFFDFCAAMCYNLLPLMCVCWLLAYYNW